jgi:hypothetical protein
MTNTVPATLSLAQMAELYNLIADKPIKKFKDKPTAIARLEKALADSGMEVFEVDGEWDVRVSSSEVDETEDTVENKEREEAVPSDQLGVAKARNSGGRRSPLLGKKIVLKRTENPKRKGSRTAVRYEVYSEEGCRTSDDFMAICLERNLGTRREILSDLAYDSQQHFIRLA